MVLYMACVRLDSAYEGFIGYRSSSQTASCSPNGLVAQPYVDSKFCNY